MKCTIPEISWHNRDPVLSVDIQPVNGTDCFQRLATGGTDSHVVIWHIEVQDNGSVKVEFAADLQRHQRAVNVVRFSPSGEFLASGDDESAIIIWKQKTDQDAPELPLGDNDNTAKEAWLGVRVLRGHMEDVYDLCWSPDSLNLISGSVDNSAILWDVHKGRNLAILKEHKGFVQGVAWDPGNQYVATLSSDRTCRVYSISSKKLVSRVSKSTLPVPKSSDLHGKVVRLFHDDTLKSFFRRLTFSPDGQLLITPSGIVENADSDKNSNATYIFTRRVLNRPSVLLPSSNQYTVAVRCCPLLFKLRDRESVFALPYRMVLAVATQNSVLLYDTQQPEPFGIVSNIHYTRLTDLAWSDNGRILVVSSTDGYCSIITFGDGELGEIYKPHKETSGDACAGLSSGANIDDTEVKSTETSKLNTSDIKVPVQNKTSDESLISENPSSNLNIADITKDVTDRTSLDTPSCDKMETNIAQFPSSGENVTNSAKPSDSSGSSTTYFKSENVKPEAERQAAPDESGNQKPVSQLVNSPSSSRTSSDVPVESKSITPKQNKPPRRITPIMLSSPKKVFTKTPVSVKQETVAKASEEIQSEPNSKSQDDTSCGDANSEGALQANTEPTCSSDGKIAPEVSTQDEMCAEISGNGKLNAKNEDEPSENNIDTNDASPVRDDKFSDSTENKKSETPANESMQVDRPDQVEHSVEKTADTGSTPMEVVGAASATPPVSPLTPTARSGQDKRTPRRVQLITLSSPKSKKKLL